MSHIKLFPSQSTPVLTLLVLKLLINHPFLGLLHLQRLPFPVCMNKCVDDASTPALNVKTRTSSIRPSSWALPKAKGHAYSCSVLADLLLYLPLNIYLFIFLTSLQCSSVSWLNVRACIFTYKPACTSLPASKEHQLHVCTSRQRAICFLFQEEKNLSCNQCLDRQAEHLCHMTPNGEEDVVPMASQPVRCTAKQTKEGGSGMDPAELRDKFKYSRLRHKLLNLRRASRNWNTGSRFCHKKPSPWGLSSLKVKNTVKISLPHKAALNVFTIINRHCHLSCSGIQCKTKHTFS